MSEERTTTEIVVSAGRIDDVVYPTATFKRTEQVTRTELAVTLQADGDLVSVTVEGKGVDLTYVRWQELVYTVKGLHDGTIKPE